MYIKSDFLPVINYYLFCVVDSDILPGTQCYWGICVDLCCYNCPDSLHTTKQAWFQFMGSWVRS